MKIPSLLAQYFYSKQRLELPGIGIFVVNIAAALQALQNCKQGLAVLEGVSFERNVLLKQSPDLIAFIAEKTGKMKALAAADLDSHLQLAHQFLNIGKPFLFEGIGTLSKIKSGEFVFTPLSISTEKINEYTTTGAIPSGPKERSSSQYESFLPVTKTKMRWKKAFTGLMLLGGLGLTIWGAYTIFKKNKKTEINTVPQKNIYQPIASDSLQKGDSIAGDQTTIAPENNYKYVLEIAKSKRAFKRYSQLKTNQWKVQMETGDSVQYKLFLLLPAIADTSRTLDSLTVMTGKKVYIEYRD